MQTQGSLPNDLVERTGSEPLAFQWEPQGTNVPTAWASSLEVRGADPNAAGHYRVVVTNVFGTAISQEAEVRIEPSNVRGLEPPLGTRFYCKGDHYQPFLWEHEDNWEGQQLTHPYPVGTNAVAVFRGDVPLRPPTTLNLPDGVQYLIFEGGTMWVGHGGTVGTLIATGGNLNFDGTATNVLVFGGSHQISAGRSTRVELVGGTLALNGAVEGYAAQDIQLRGCSNGRVARLLVASFVSR